MTLASLTSSMPGMDGEVGVQTALSRGGETRNVRYRLGWTPQGMRISNISYGERGDPTYAGIWHQLSAAQREAPAR